METETVVRLAASCKSAIPCPAERQLNHTFPVPGGPCHNVTVLVSAAVMAEA